MFDGILHKGLQDQRRQHERIFRVQFIIHLEAFPETRLFQMDIGADVLEFFPDGDHGIRIRQVFAVIIGQIVDQRFRGLGLLRAVITDRAQRVKQEMRINL